MAEAVGLAMGAVSLAALFTTCIECFDYISLVRNHGQDYEVSMTKLLLLKARLSAWGESLLVEEQGRENVVLRQHWLEEQDTVGKCLVGIKAMFEETGQMESKYGLKALSAGPSSLSVVQTQRSKAFRRIESVFKSKTEGRQKNASLSKKISWAIHDKKKFDSLIADLAFFIGGLEDLSDRLQVIGLQQRLLQVEIQAITDTDSINLMEQASNEVPALAIAESGNEEACERNAYGHTYIGTMIKDRAKVLNGNIGHQSRSFHLYRNTQASDDAHVVQGDVSNEAALAFFR